DQYEPDDRHSMITRYAELGGGQGPLGDRPSERNLAEHCRRFANGDVVGILEGHADGFTLIDRRKLGWAELRKDDGSLREAHETFLGAAYGCRLEVDQVFACDDSLIACLLTFHGRSYDGGGPFEIAYGAVCEVEGGLFQRVEHFERDDRAGMLARYGELGSG